MTDSPGRYRFTPDEELLDELKARRELQAHARNFLLAGGILAGYSDGDFSPEEQNYLASALNEAFGDDASAINSIESPKQAIALLEASCAWLKEHGSEQRYTLFRHLAILIAVDNELAPAEFNFVKNVAKSLDLEQKQATKIVSDALFEEDKP